MVWNATPLSLTCDEEFRGGFDTHCLKKPRKVSMTSKRCTVISSFSYFIWSYQLKRTNKKIVTSYFTPPNQYFCFDTTKCKSWIHLTNIVPHTLQIMQNGVDMFCDVFCAVLQLAKNPDRGVFLEICNKGGRRVAQSTNTFDTLFKWAEPTLASWWGGI